MGIVYSALKEKDEVRLLRLEPGSPSDPVNCSLFHARLGESPSYDALSYMWGEVQEGGSDPSHWIQVDDGRTMEVRENLRNALRYMRQMNKVRILWVDAICINQADDGERGHQVAQMGMIYSQATTVRVWLGLPDKTTPSAFRFLSDPSSAHQLKQGATEPSDWEWEAVLQLCRREYWERLWIVQEVVLAARIDIHCGERVLPWDTLSEVLFAVEEEIQRIGTGQRKREGICYTALARIVNSAAMKIVRQRRANTDSGPVTMLSSLLTLLWTHKDAKCLDVRDKIFGLHSFAPECCRSSIPVDYSCSAFELCRRLLGHDIHCHWPRMNSRGNERTLQLSLELHDLIIGGALKQIGSKNPLDIGHLMRQKHSRTDSGKTIVSRKLGSFKVLGRQCGQVSFVTAPLKSLFIENESVRVPSNMIHSFQALGFASEDWEDPHVTETITKALGHVWRKAARDLIHAESVTMTENIAAGRQELLDLHQETSGHGLRGLMIFVAEFLRTSEFLQTLPVYEDCVMFMCQSGLEWKIGFAPVSTQTGDMICTFKDTDVIAIVRESCGKFDLIGQGSRIDFTGAAWSSWRRHPVPIEFDLPSLQAFSRRFSLCRLPDYRIVLTVPPRESEEKRYPPKELRKNGKGLLRRPRTLILPQIREDPPYILPYDSDPPSYLYTGHNPGHRVSEHSAELPGRGWYAEKKYACPRCHLTFTNSRDNLRHARTWSHQRCKKCSCWTSWESTVSTTSTTQYCTQCRIDDPSYAVDVPVLVVEERPSHIWSETDTATSSGWSSIGESMSQTTDLSSTASTTSDRHSMGLDEIVSNSSGARMPFSHTRRHICDEKCRLFGGSHVDRT